MLPFGAVAKKFADAQRLEVWRNNPAKWAEEHGLCMWSKQREVSQSVVEHQKTLVVTGNGVGKANRVVEIVPTPTGWTTIGELRVVTMFLTSMVSLRRLLLSHLFGTSHWLRWCSMMVLRLFAQRPMNG